MRIFISALRLNFGQAFGGGSFLSGLLLGLEKNKTKHKVYVGGNAALTAWMRRETPSLIPLESAMPKTSYERVWSESRLAPHLAAKVGADISYFPFNLAPAMPTKTVVFVHDLASVYYLKNHPLSNPIKNLAIAWKVRATCRRSDVILTGTQETQKQIINTGWPADASKVFCVNDAVVFGKAISRQPDAADISPDCFLALLTGTNHPHKDRITAVRGFRHFISSHPHLADSVKLVITGSDDDQDIRGELRAPELNGKVHSLGFVDSKELEWLMQRANAMLLPTRHEGFGLGILEAQHRGVPLLAGNIPVVREVSGGAALFFEPGDHKALAFHLANLYYDEKLAKTLAKDGRVNAARYSIERMTRETIQVLENVASEIPLAKAQNLPHALGSPSLYQAES